jgi:hypothetical protein
MATITRDICKAKRYVGVSAAYLRWAKAQAHRSHRRAWRQHLAQMAGGYENERKELALDRPRFTGWDLA